MVYRIPNKTAPATREREIPAVTEDIESLEPEREFGEKVESTWVPKGTPLRNRTPLVYPGEPRAIVRRVYAVTCPNCMELVPSPFNGDPLWANEHFIIRARHVCPACNQRFKVK